jgi:hypothetical protein
MRRGCIMAVAIAATLSGAEIIDEIAVSVGSRVITEQDLDREIRVTALENNGKPDFSPANKRTVAGRMVDQLLIRNELEASHYPGPTTAEINAALAEEKARYGSPEAYRQALARYGITEDELRARLAWQLTLVRFIDIRFRPGIQIGDEEIRQYFEEHIRPEWEKEHPGTAPSIEPYRRAIAQKLESQAADQQVEQWLTEARRRTHIVYHVGQARGLRGALGPAKRGLRGRGRLRACPTIYAACARLGKLGGIGLPRPANGGLSG